MKLTIWLNHTIASLASLSQGDLTYHRDPSGTVPLAPQRKTKIDLPQAGTDLGCNTELRAATLESVLARLA